MCAFILSLVKKIQIFCEVVVIWSVGCKLKASGFFGGMNECSCGSGMALQELNSTLSW